MDIKEFLIFFKFQNKLKNIRRNNFMEDGRKESSAEHSWSVAMMVWILCESVSNDLKINLDQARMIKMALVHDIAEIEAGDVAAWDIDARKTISSQEQTAIENIATHITEPYASEIQSLWTETENKETSEGKLVKACDQLCPLIYRLVYNNSYKGTSMTKEKLDSIFLPIVSFSNTTYVLYTTLREELSSRGYFIP